ILYYKLGGNSILDYLIIIGVVIVSYLLIKLIEQTIIKRSKIRAENTESKLDDILIKGIEKYIFPLILIGIIYMMLIHLHINSDVRKIIDIAAMILATYFIIQFLSAIISYYIEVRWLKGEDATKSNRVKAILPIVNILIWIIAIIFLLDNLGLKISAIITGLGIGGIAIALGTQTLLKDLFGYLTILLDRPFEVGDFIAVDAFSGTIDKIGIKSTQIRSIDGEMLIFSNSDLTNSRIKNYHKMINRRVLLKFGIVYETPLEKIKQVPQIIEEIIKDIKGTRFDRAHFAQYSNYSLNFEVVYYIEDNDYTKFMNIQQDINLKIAEEFAENNIQFAYPTQVIYLNNPNEVIPNITHE
ncbi:MAG TPA: mechanosensitive ion channel, partial [Bacteroidota bacterium]|nr:mechanosensitive ion channel [Bacteroidota bacterium]